MRQSSGPRNAPRRPANVVTIGQNSNPPVGELRPSQMLYSYGVGAIVDLPKIAAMVMGLDDWDTNYCIPIEEKRLLAAVRASLGDQVEALRLPPYLAESGIPGVFEQGAHIGVPVAAFPRTMICPVCRLVSSVGSGLFELQPNLFRPERTCYVHTSCQKANRPEVLPVRFVLACKNGHLDDFPWRWFCHQGPSGCNGALRLTDAGITGEATDMLLKCEGCGKGRRMSDAFGDDAAMNLPSECSGRRPHLRDKDEKACRERVKCILVGSSNAWFPLTLSTLYLPVASDLIGQLIEQHWANLQSVTSAGVLAAYRTVPALAPIMSAFGVYTDEELFAAIETHRNRTASGLEPYHEDIKTPEWRMLADFRPENNGQDFYLRAVVPPLSYRSVIAQVVLVERLREVKALIGFTRIESPGEFSDVEDINKDTWVPLSRKAPKWVPASEVRGEGIFLKFDVSAIEAWAARPSVSERNRLFDRAHQKWRESRGLPPDSNYPGIGYIMIHSFSHALMRQLVVACGYTAASIRERLYWPRPDRRSEPMAGVMLYTAAPDSEGTLGGLVRLGMPDMLENHIAQALEMVILCASDPLCAEHDPVQPSATLHGASCHACLFSPETSCERSNKYLDRSLLVPTLEHSDLYFFPHGD